MTILELINDSIQNMANKPSVEAIDATQRIAKGLDNALTKDYNNKWMCLTIQENEMVDVVSVGNNPRVICRIYDKEMFKEICDIFYGIDVEKMKKKQPIEAMKFSDFIEQLRKTHYQ